MAEIRVDPAALKSNAKQIMIVSSAVQKAGDLAWRSASGAPSYDGQFGPKVRALGQAALTRAKKQSASTNLLSGSLSKRAKAFEAADAAAVKGVATSLLKIYAANSSKFAMFGYFGIVASMLREIMRILGLAGFGKGVKQLPITLVPGSTSKGNIGGGITVYRPKIFKIAEKVPAGSMTAVNYRRGVSSSKKANCTWYAAHAVEVASGGRIKIDSKNYPKLGNAGDWAKNCSTNPPPPGVTGVDKTATAGSVFCVSGHVGFVENVYEKDGETYITWSEEGWNRDSCPWTGGNRVDVGDDSVYRYRITKKLSDFTNYYTNKGKVVNYIHFDYE